MPILDLVDVTSDAWREYDETLRLVLSLLTKKRFAEALNQIDRYLQGDNPRALAVRALTFKGTVYEEEGNYESAVVEYQKALIEEESASYFRYTTELSIAGCLKRMSRIAEARLWYSKALRTVNMDPGTSGAAAILGLLDIAGSAGLTREEDEICRDAISSAWALFRLPENPDLMDLRRTANILSAAGTRPVPGLT